MLGHDSTMFLIGHHPALIHWFVNCLDFNRIVAAMSAIAQTLIHVSKQRSTFCDNTCAM